MSPIHLFSFHASESDRESPPSADLRQDTTHQDAKSAVLSLCRRTLLSLLHDYLQGRFEGSTDRLFNLLYTLGPNLTDGSVVILLEGYSRENICLPR